MMAASHTARTQQTAAKMALPLTVFAILAAAVFTIGAGEWLVPLVLITLLSLDLYRTFVR